jgi:hypothetical protein
MEDFNKIIIFTLLLPSFLPSSIRYNLNTESYYYINPLQLYIIVLLYLYNPIYNLSIQVYFIVFG